MASDQPRLVINLTIQEPSTTESGRLVEASVYATNSTEQVIALVNLTISDPSGNIVAEISDDDGGVSEDVPIDFDSEAGIYTADIQATAEGYTSASTSETFEVAG